MGPEMIKENNPHEGHSKKEKEARCEQPFGDGFEFDFIHLFSKNILKKVNNGQM